MDKVYWKDPENFRPERWISDNGSVVKHDHYIPFSIGKIYQVMWSAKLRNFSENSPVPSGTNSHVDPCDCL